MKRILLSLSFMVIVMISFCQENPVNWGYEAKKKANDTYDLVITADITQPWHLYSQQNGKGVRPTSFVFKANPLVTRIGKVKEQGNLEKTVDKYMGEIFSYQGKVLFVQTVKVKAGIKTNLSGMVEYQVCDDSHCLPAVKKIFNLSLQ